MVALAANLIPIADIEAKKKQAFMNKLKLLRIGLTTNLVNIIKLKNEHPSIKLCGFHCDQNRKTEG